MHSFIVRAVFLTATVVFAARTTVQPAEAAADILSRVREACGYAGFERHREGVRLTGNVNGASGQKRLDFVFTPRWDARLELTSGLRQVELMSGATMRRVDWGGEVRDMDFSDRSQWIGDAGILSGLLLAQGAGVGFEIDRDLSTAREAVLTAKFEGGRSFVTVTIDRATWRPRQWYLFYGDGAFLYTLTGELRFDGIWFPATVSRGGESLAFTQAGPAPPTEFRVERTVPPDASFDATVSSRLRVARTRDGRLLVRPLLDGADQGWFLLDTGAAMTTIESALADKLKWEIVGSSQFRGIGHATEEGMLARLQSFTLGPLCMSRPLVSHGSLGLAEQLGPGVVGVVGYPVFARSVVEIDAAGGRVGLHDAGTYRLPAGEWQPMRLDGTLPVVPVSIERHPGLFGVDTGGAGLVIHEPAVRRWKLLDGRPVESSLLQGAGGRVTLKKGRVSGFELAGTGTRDEPAYFAIDPYGNFIDRYTDGLVGITNFPGIVMVLDYPNARMALVEKSEWDFAAMPIRARVAPR